MYSHTPLCHLGSFNERPGQLRSGLFSCARPSFVSPPQFGQAWTFSEGLAPVKIEGLCGYIDKTGSMVVRPQFTGAKIFREGIALVQKDGEWCYIDRKGKIVFEPKK